MKWERGKVTVFRENSNGANGLTFDHQGRLLTCETGRVTRTEKDGKITTLAQKGLNNPNDLVYSIDGSVYFSDLLPRGATGKSLVYQITRKGELRVATGDCDRPNGVALSPNQQKLYVADSGARNTRMTVHLKDGKKLQQFVEIARTIAAPLTNDQIVAKYRTLTDGIVTPQRQADIADFVLNVEANEDLSGFVRLLAPAVGAAFKE